MNLFRFLYVLYTAGYLSPSGLFRLIRSIYKYGINIMALLYFASITYAGNPALVDEHESLRYEELFSHAKNLAIVLKEKYQLKSGQRVGFLCKNHCSLVKSVFAVSLIGADIYLLNAEMSKAQFNNLAERYNFDLLIYDFELTPLIEKSGYIKYRILSSHSNLPAINNLLDTSVSLKAKLNRTSSSKIIILTGGTTGNFKTAVHKPSLFNFINPFITLITRLKLLNYNTAYIATPVYHGYGIGILILFIALGKKIVIAKRFEAKESSRLIREQKVEVITVVPLMLHKMLNTCAQDLKSLACIASGGAELSPRLVVETFSKLGDVLYNLYGTSETGLNIIATPQDLRYSAKTIGRKINGVQLRILDEKNNEVELGKIGRFCIRNSWSMKNINTPWIETGDLGYQDESGYYFLCGRADDMIVSAGENVYPIEVEQVLINHPQVEDVAVIGISDEHFGQRLKAYVLPAKDACITKDELNDWLRVRLARFQMPKEITFVGSMPYTPLGKLDKKQLKQEYII